MFASRGSTSMSSIPPPHLPSLSSLQYAPRPEIQRRDRRNDFTTTLPPLRSLDRSIDQHAREDQSALTSDEHERTRQERLKLERAKVKRDMLRELLQAGVHPSQIPAFFAQHEAAASPSSSPVEAPNYTTQHHPTQGSSPAPSTWNGSPSFAAPASAARRPAYSPVQADLPFGMTTNPSPPHQQQPNHLRSHYTTTPPQQHSPSHLRTQSANPPTIQVQQSTPTLAPQQQSALSAIPFATSPRALQFKFYKPGPKQKVLRRKRNNSTATATSATAPSPMNGIRKDTSRRLSTNHARRASAAGSSPSSASPRTETAAAGSSLGGTSAGSQHEHDVIMSDADEESEDGGEHDAEGSGSEEG